MKNLLLPILAIAALPLIPTDTAAQISLYDTDGNVIFSSKETPAYIDFNYNAPTKGEENGHAWVDLGLPSGTLWATCNIGATNPEDYGDYYAWGETQTKTSYDWTTYKWMDPAVNGWKGCTKYQAADGQTDGVWYDSEGNFIGDGKTELETSDDVASQTWGGKWQIPTTEMQQELSSQCYWVWTTTYNGKSVNGYIVYKAKSDADKGAKVTSGSSPSSDYDVATDPHLFLPAAGGRYGSVLNDAGLDGYYWSRSLYPNYSIIAYGLNFRSGYVRDSSADSRSHGFAVRPVVLPAAE
ncbi:MAG: DUF1566 domain-containing protein [Bacteroidales bacterium]|nr:DUF1566 domain-containing protein [Bacteroidales bacterium]